MTIPQRSAHPFSCVSGTLLLMTSRFVCGGSKKFSRGVRWAGSPAIGHAHPRGHTQTSIVRDMGRNKNRKRKRGPEEIAEASGVAGPPSKKSALPPSALETIRKEYSDKSLPHSQQKPKPTEINEHPQKQLKEGDSSNSKDSRKGISRPPSLKPSNKKKKKKSNVRYTCTCIFKLRNHTLIKLIYVLCRYPSMVFDRITLDCSYTYFSPFI